MRAALQEGGGLQLLPVGSPRAATPKCNRGGLRRVSVVPGAMRLARRR
jgi:hypothetical protein